MNKYQKYMRYIGVKKSNKIYNDITEFKTDILYPNRLHHSVYFKKRKNWYYASIVDLKSGIAPSEIMIFNAVKKVIDGKISFDIDFSDEVYVDRGYFDISIENLKLSIRNFCENYDYFIN